MYPPPPDQVLRALMATPVFAVSYGKYVIHLVFENEDRISVGGPIRFGHAGDISRMPVIVFPMRESAIMRVVGSIIAEISCESDGTLVLRFSSGDILVAYTTDLTGEAYSLFVGGREYVI